MPKQFTELIDGLYILNLFIHIEYPTPLAMVNEKPVGCHLEHTTCCCRVEKSTRSRSNCSASRLCPTPIGEAGIVIMIRDC